MTEVPLPDESFGVSRDSNRPLGVTLIAILQILQAIALIVFGILTLVVPFIGIPLLVIGLILFYIGKGLWEMENWAWLWAIILNIIGGLIAIASNNWISLVLSVIIVIYLNTEDIKSRFGR
ncbi:hypothetical protein EU537_02240 [Candidatus Thorarchaeota archaeon]|nr:MAG: hypothetical protein EU537_02240 [Candidatus Thorarchaeota archaeon]